jgi:hypothetical protein
VLLAVAGLLVASFMRLQGVDPRFKERCINNATFTARKKAGRSG